MGVRWEAKIALLPARLTRAGYELKYADTRVSEGQAQCAEIDFNRIFRTSTHQVRQRR